MVEELQALERKKPWEFSCFLLLKVNDQFETWLCTSVKRTIPFFKVQTTCSKRPCLRLLDIFGGNLNLSPIVKIRTLLAILH